MTLYYIRFFSIKLRKKVKCHEITLGRLVPSTKSQWDFSIGFSNIVEKKLCTKYLHVLSSEIIFIDEL